ncbi:hypothetical protein GQ457_15G021780 [Hibiscus cannabinus]
MGGKTLVDSNEDEETVDPNLTLDDVGDELVFGGGEFVLAGNDITWYAPPSHVNLIDYDAMKAPKFSVIPQVSSGSYDEFSTMIQFKEKEEATLGN